MAFVKEQIKKHPVFVSIYYKIVNFLKPKRYYVSFIKKLYFKIVENDSGFLMINIGGGNFCRMNWKSLDFLGFDKKIYKHNRFFIDYNFNLLTFNKFPFDDQSVKYFYSSHTLEHIPQKYCQHILDEIYRCLIDKGALRLTMPDFDLLYEGYKNSDEEFYELYRGENIHQKFIGTFATHLKNKKRPSNIKRNFDKMSKNKFADYYIRKVDELSQKKIPNNHINWWNYKKTQRMLKRAGFKKIYRSEEQGSKFSELRGKSWLGHGFDMTHPTKSLFVEAVKYK